MRAIVLAVLMMGCGGGFTTGDPGPQATGVCTGDCSYLFGGDAGQVEHPDGSTDAATAPQPTPTHTPAPAPQPGGDTCPVLPVALVCVTGSEFHVTSTTGNTTRTIPCGQSSPACPSGWACSGVNAAGTLLHGVCP